MEKIFASIITIGDELLIGQVIDTNSAFIAQELNKIGILIKHRVAVGDNEQDIVKALNDESKASKIIIITGGLGPTADDITKPLLCKYFNGKMILHEPTLQFIEHLFANVLKRPMIERNRKQAEVPDLCKVLHNEKGTAPGMMFEKNDVIYFSLPGVPHEMKWITMNHVIPIVQSIYQLGSIVHKTILVAGIGESFLADMIETWENKIPSHIKLAYLPNNSLIRLRLTGFGSNKEVLENEVFSLSAELKVLVKDYLVADEDLPIETVISNLLKEKNKTLATAESCTGGSIASIITSHAGASSFFTGSIVCYDNRIKTEVLHVPYDVLNTVGAVSKQTVQIMANSVMNLMKTDYSIAVSGIMGPSGATPEKPVGLVWIAVANKEEMVVQEFNFKYDRQRNIQLTMVAALNMLRKLILKS